MIFVLLGLLLIALNLLGVSPVAAWNWQITGDLWKFATPFLFAVVWWLWADKSGLNKRREIEKMEARKDDRRRENLVAMGLDPRHKRRSGKR
jgi:small Trp-rich protein